MNPQFLLAIAIAALLTFAASGSASSPKRKPIADIEHWRCQVNENHWLKFRVVEGEMRAPKQAWPKGMLEENSIKCWAWIERPQNVDDAIEKMRE